MTEYFKWSIVQKWLGTDGVSERLSSYCMDGLISLELPEAPLSQPSSSNMTTAAHDEDDHESRHFLSETELIELIGTVQQWQLFIIFLAIVVFAFVVARLSKWVVIGVQKDQVTTPFLSCCFVLSIDPCCFTFLVFSFPCHLSRYL